MYDDHQERFLIYETTSEHDKYYCLKYDEERPNHVYITCYTSVGKELDLREYARDIEESMLIAKSLWLWEMWSLLTAGMFLQLMLEWWKPHHISILGKAWLQHSRLKKVIKLKLDNLLTSVDTMKMNLTYLLTFSIQYDPAQVLRKKRFSNLLTRIITREILSIASGGKCISNQLSQDNHSILRKSLTGRKESPATIPLPKINTKGFWKNANA